MKDASFCKIPKAEAQDASVASVLPSLEELLRFSQRNSSDFFEKNFENEKISELDFSSQNQDSTPDGSFQDLEDLIAPKKEDATQMNSDREFDKCFLGDESTGSISDRNIINNSNCSFRKSKTLVLESSRKAEYQSSFRLKKNVFTSPELSSPSKIFSPSFEDDFCLEFREDKSKLDELLTFLSDKYQYVSAPSTREESLFPELRTPSPKLENFSFDISSEVNSNSKVLKGKYLLCEKIGEGTFADVFEVKDLTSGKTFCAKKITTSGASNSAELSNQTLNEISTLRKLLKAGDPSKHKFVEMVDFFVSNDNIFVIFELLGKSLGDIIDREESLEFENFQLVARDTLDCLKFLQELNIIHGDLRPENILMSKGGASSSKVIDFGASVLISEQSDQMIQSQSYRAPEVSLKRFFDTKADMWSFGVIFYFLWTRAPLFHYHSPLQNLAKAMSLCRFFPSEKRFFEQNPEIFSRNFVVEEHRSGLCSVYVPKALPSLQEHLRALGFPPALADLVAKCLSFEPSKRISCEEAIAHPFFMNCVRRTT